MAKKATKTDGKSLVIVESPAKARTISRFLGPDYTVEASIGHIRDLPKGGGDVPKEYKKKKWKSLAVNVEENFEPIYIVPDDKREQVNKLKGLLKSARELYLATDEDREGEAISWHLQEVLKPEVPVHRLVFHEITEEAIKDALDHPRSIDESLVRAQETRRILDRLFGYEVSPLLWRKIGKSRSGRTLSAGRVQSVAVRLIVEREKERMAFVSASYWDLLGLFATKKQENLSAELVSVDGRRIPTGKDFDSSTGKLRDQNLMLLSEKGAADLLAKLEKATFKVIAVEEKPYTSKPAAPFTTSTLQQEANRKLGFTARRTMSVAQSLYENGYITYMRTDSTNLAQVAIDAARDLVRSQYGADYLPPTPRVYKSKVKNAQEAHEAIRPAGHPFQLPEALKGVLSSEQFKLFELIWKRTIASQMKDAAGRMTKVTIEGDGAHFQVTGKTIDFAGYLRAYVEGSDDPQAELADREAILPSVATGDVLDCKKLESKQHVTQPPSRFSEAALTKALEEMGIGRPSTYASIIETIIDREYVVKRASALVPTWLAFAVSRLLEEHLPEHVDYQFTAQLEDSLDAISRQEADHISYLRDFYFGKNGQGLKEKLNAKIEEVDPREINRFEIGAPKDGPNLETIYLRVGKFGPFIEQGERKTKIPIDLAPDELTVDKAIKLFEEAGQSQEPIGHDPATGKPVYAKVGRFGPYIQLGEVGGEEKPKSASLLKGMTLGSIDLTTALKLLSLPRTLGEHPETKEPVIAATGRFGAYVKSGKETRSLPADLSPIEINLEQALHVLAQPKALSRRMASAPQPLKTLEKSPVTNNDVKVFNGRYGLYVTDGVTNATLPKDSTPEEITLELALQLLADRAAAGPPKKGKRKAAKIAGAPKKAVKKDAASDSANGDSQGAKAPKKKAAKKKAN